MQRQLQRNDLDDEPRLHFDFALGEALRMPAEYEPSFRHYLDGNALRLKLVPYSADDMPPRAAQMALSSIPGILRRTRGLGCDAPDPSSSSACRAGSTLVEQILSSHPAVEGTMELPEIILARALRRRAESPQATSLSTTSLAGIDAGEARALGEQYLQRTRIHRKRGARCSSTRCRTTSPIIGLIRLALPNAKIIDAPASARLLPVGLRAAFRPRPGLQLFARRHRPLLPRLCRTDGALRRGAARAVHRVIYEEMVADTEAEVRRLLAYCGLPFDEGPALLREPRAVRTASSEQVRQPIYREGVDHWRHYEAWLEPLKQALRAVLDAYPQAPHPLAT